MSTIHLSHVVNLSFLGTGQSVLYSHFHFYFQCTEELDRIYEKQAFTSGPHLLCFMEDWFLPLKISGGVVCEL